MGKFKITEEMKKRAEENKSKIESSYIEDMDYIGTSFCNDFWTNGNFDTRGGDSDPMLMYVWDIGGHTVVIEWEARRSDTQEFLEFIEEKENYILSQNEKIKEEKENKEEIFNSIAELYDIIEEGETDTDFILSELARIQNYAK